MVAQTGKAARQSNFSYFNYWISQKRFLESRKKNVQLHLPQIDNNVAVAVVYCLLSTDLDTQEPTNLLFKLQLDSRFCCWADCRRMKISNYFAWSGENNQLENW